jgi:hypothetical protein
MLAKIGLVKPTPQKNPGVASREYLNQMLRIGVIFFAVAHVKIFANFTKKDVTFLTLKTR